MPFRADHYRAKAAECEQRAKEAQDPEDKRNFADLARQWLYLAEHADRSRTPDGQTGEST